jgi:branched-chain amino acid transport system permease protein
MGTSVDILAIQAMHGLVYGMLLFMVASGLTLVLGMMGVLNIAHVAFYMLGAYLAYSLSQFFHSFWISLLLSPLIVAALSIVIERFFLRKTYKEGHLPQILLTFGLFFIFSEVVRLIWGSQNFRMPEPALFSGDMIFLGKTFPLYRLFLLGFSLATFLGMALLLRRTRIGIIIRAAVSDADMVEALGNNIQRYFIGVFAFGAFLAALAGVIAAPLLTIFSGMGDQVLLDCFVIIIVGGFGSLLGAFIASLMIGQLQSFGILWIPELAIVFEFLLMAVVLIIRPMGLLGEET